MGKVESLLLSVSRGILEIIAITVGIRNLEDNSYSEGDKECFRSGVLNSNLGLVPTFFCVLDMIKD